MLISPAVSAIESEVHMTRLTLFLILTLPVCAGSIGNQVFNFTGTCEDCSGTATATLTLGGSYVLGTNLQDSDFISLIYHSNLVDLDETADDGTFSDISGNLPVGLGFAQIDVEDNFDFETDTEGFWDVGIDDHGANGVWSQQAAASAPEPATWIELAGGLTVLTLLRRRR